MARSRSEHRGGMFDRPVRLLGGAAALVMALWCAFTASVKPHEVLVGLLATALAIAFFAQVLRAETLPLHLGAKDLAHLWRVPWHIMSGCWEITWLLLKDFAGTPPGSVYRDCGFVTSRRNPTLVGRTVLAVAYTTAAPNFIVLGVDPAQSLMVFHQLKRTTVPRMTQALGARP